MQQRAAQPELGADVSPLTLNVENIDSSTLRVKLGAPGRWEVPRSLLRGTVNSAPPGRAARPCFLAASPGGFLRVTGCALLALTMEGRDSSVCTYARRVLLHARQLCVVLAVQARTVLRRSTSLTTTLCRSALACRAWAARMPIQSSAPEAPGSFSRQPTAWLQTINLHPLLQDTACFCASWLPHFCCAGCLHKRTKKPCFVQPCSVHLLPSAQPFVSPWKRCLYTLPVSVEHVLLRKRETAAYELHVQLACARMLHRVGALSPAVVAC